MTMLPRVEDQRTTSQRRARLHVTADTIPAALGCKSATPLAARVAHLMQPIFLYRVYSSPDGKVNQPVGIIAYEEESC